MIMSKKDPISEADRFWDVESFLPQKHPKPITVRTSNTDAVTVEVPGDEKTVMTASPTAASTIPARESLKDVPRVDINIPLAEYVSENPFINSVRILLWPSRYTFYERFRRDALRYFDRHGMECHHVPFFSYMPQYAQLDVNQRAWYFFWRDCVRRGEMPKCDMSYILLLVYEIINLPDRIPPQEGLELLCRIWLSYRKDYPRLDRYLCEWVCDYCLINQLQPPYRELEGIIPDIMKAATFKEFYIASGADSGADARLVSLLIAFSSNYYYKNSKYITPETEKLFEKHIGGAFLYTYRRLAGIDPRFDTTKNEAMKVRFTRDAYLGALCAYDVKRKIEIEYFAFSRSPELRMVTTDIIKCAENHIRSYLGIKSRLSCPGVGDRIKGVIGEYFEKAGMKRKKKTQAEIERESYEQLYEARSSALSTDAALEIERKSWAVTEMLEDAFREEAIEENAVFQDHAPTDAASDVIKNEPTEEILIEAAQEEYALEKQAFSLLLAGDIAGFTALASERNMLTEALVDRLNELSFDFIGDITIEAGDGISVIEDYKEDIEEWMNR